jgi:hypothetical protein
MSTSDNTSNILRKEASEILDQIRKRAEDISTSEASNRLFHNLSNPTNLTNPQIITIRKRDYLGNSEISKNNRIHFTKIRTRNIQRPYRRDKDMDEETITELHEQFLINEQFKKLIFRKKQKPTFDNDYDMPKMEKYIDKEIYDYNNKKQLGRKIKKNNSMNIIDEKGIDIWNKIKSDDTKLKAKTIRINERKHITSREYISKTKYIQLLRYIQKNKIEKLNKMIYLKKSELDTLNNNIESLENNRNIIMTNYNNKYVTYLSYLKRQKDKEEKNNIDLLIKSGKIRREISQIQSKINKVQKEKMLKLNLILLFIQIKERIREIPQMAYKLFRNTDNNMNMKNNESNKRLSLKKRIESNITKENESNKEEDLIKILKYKGKKIYNDIYEFDYDYNQIEEKIRKNILYNENIKKEINELKARFKEVQKEMEYDPYLERRNYLNHTLNDLIFKNEELTSELQSIKIKLGINDNYLTKKSRNAKIQSKIRKSSSSINLFQYPISIKTNNTNTSNNFFNEFPTSNTNATNTIYNHKNILSFKKYFKIERFDFTKASNLFLSCYNLYNITKDNLFPEQDIKFDITLTRGSSLEPEKSTILKMLEYIDIVVSLIIKEKHMYLSDKILRKKYEKMRELLDKDKRRMKFIVSFRIEEEKRKLKLKQLHLKKEKTIYISSHKIENKHFLKTKKEKIAKAIHLAEIRKTPVFEDFMYDIMV